MTLLAFLVINMYYVDSEEMELTTEETRLITPNTYVYNYIEMLDKSSKVNTFFYDDKPPLSKTVQVELNETIELKNSNFKYWARFLNKGSEVQIVWKSSSQVSFYIIQGSKRFKDWTKSPKNKYLSHDAASSSKRVFIADTSDDYFFVMENDGNLPRITATASFYIVATCFDTSKAKGFYAGSFRMDFPFATNQYLVLNNPSQIHSLLVSISFSSRFHFSLFVALFVQTIVICGCLFWKLTLSSGDDDEYSLNHLESGYSYTKLT